MCLDTVTKKHPLDTRIRIGYKVFAEMKTGQLISQCQGNRRPLEVGKWLNEIRYRKDNVLSYISDWYETGWHIFATKAGAIDWSTGCFLWTTIKKVKFRRIVAAGKQRDYKVYVAKEIMIMEEKVS